MPSHYFKKFSKTYLLLCTPIFEIGEVVGTLLATHEAMDGAAGETARESGCLIRQVGSSGFGTEVSNWKFGPQALRFQFTKETHYIKGPKAELSKFITTATLLQFLIPYYRL